MDPFSISAGTASFISLGLQVCRGLLAYYSSWKCFEEDIQAFYTKAEGLAKIFTVLDGAVQNPKLHQDAVKLIQDQMSSCADNLKKLEKTFEKVKKGNFRGNSILDKVKAQGRRAFYPFRESTIAKLKENVSGVLEDLQVAVQALQLDTTVTQIGVVESLATGIATLTNETSTKNVSRWLAAPDHSSNHHAACKKKQPSTGSWLLDGDKFKSWKREPCSLLCLNGKPGSGKTILCSTVIQDLLAFSCQTSGVAVAYFYFAFSNPDLQLCGPAVRSIVKQLSINKGKLPKELDALYAQCQNGQQQPSLNSLKRVLRSLIGQFRHSYIVFDALDECTERLEILEVIEDLVQSGPSSLHVCITGRCEKDIIDGLEHLNPTQVVLSSTSIDADIRTFLKSTLQSDRKLRKWPQDLQDIIERTLLDESDGM